MTAGNVRITVLSAFVVCWSAAAPAMAQERGGFWIGAGTGLGSTGVSCGGCDSEREGGGTGYIRAGWTMNDRLLIGGDVNIWRKGAELEEGLKATINLYSVLGTATFYPSRSSGLFVKGGAGVSLLDTDVDFAGMNFTVEMGKGLGLLAGVGYDFRVGRRISVTPAMNAWYGDLGDVKVSGETLFERWKHNVVDFTIGITFH